MRRRYNTELQIHVEYCAVERPAISLRTSYDVGLTARTLTPPHTQNNSKIAYAGIGPGRGEREEKRWIELDCGM